MDNMFNTDSGLRPPSPLTFSSAPGQGLFGDSLGYEDFRFPNQDFINMPVSPGQSAPAQPPPPPPNMMMMAPNDPSMQLFNPTEQRYFSEFLDTLVVDQDFTFDPSAIPNLPNLSLFSQDALPGGFSLENSQSTNNPYTSAAQQLQQQLYPHQHSMGTTTVQGAMDYDMSSGFKTNEQQESSYGSQSVPAKRTKTNKANGAGSEALTLDATHSQDAAAASKQLSKLSLDNPQHTNGHHQAGTPTTPPAAKRPSKAKKNKREEAEKYAQSSGHRNHRGSSSSASSRSRSHSQSQSRAQLKEEESGHEQHDSVSDDYVSDAPALKSNNKNGNSNGTPKGATHESSSSSPTSAAATAATTKRKPYKELLTEEEKRANHIASEQKRRNTIRNGFKDMTDIIPDLKDVNSSKSTILFKAVDFIKYLERRNQILQEKAQLLETRLSMQKGQHPHSYQHPHQHQHQHQHNSTSQHPSPPQQAQQQQHSQQHLQQQQSLQQQQQKQPYHPQHLQHSYPHQHSQQSYQNQQLAAYNGAGLDDKRLQDIPNIYPVGLTR
ncbi:unnamed protein product [Mortierella alpina]